MYKEYNDYEILYMIGENDDDTFNLLYKKYYPLILKYARKYKNSFKKFGYELDDIMQIGYISLYKAVRKYEYYSENMFYTFLIKLLDNDYNIEYNKCSNYKNKCLNDSISYDKEITGTDLSILDIVGKYDFDYVEDSDNYDKYLDFKNSLPFEASCNLELKISGYKDSEIEKLLDIKHEELLENYRVIKRFILDI